MGKGAVNSAGGSIDDSAFANLNAGGLKQSMLLTFSAESLPNTDTASKSDTFVVLWGLKTMKGQSRVSKTKLGQTEVIFDNLNP